MLQPSPDDSEQPQIDFSLDTAGDSAGPGENGDALGVYLREIRGAELLTAEEEIALFQRAESGSYAESARHTLIAANLRLVVSICRRYAHFGMDFLDLIQEGNIGLMAAVKGFDWRRGKRFSSFAAPTIRGYIMGALTERAHTIRIPRHARRKLKLGAKGLPWEPVSLETPISEDGDVTLGDSIIDENATSPFEAVVSQTLSERTAEILNTLTPREAQILRMRFGLDGGPEHTLEMLAEQIGVTRERVRQIEAKALRKLRHPRRSYQLRSFDSHFTYTRKEIFTNGIG